jgi:hypothetical protein
MRESIRRKIDAALSDRRGRTPLPASNAMPLALSTAERIVGGEKLYTLAEVARKCNMDKTTLAKKLRGRAGFLQYADRGAISITESLFKAFLTEAAARGLSRS